MGIITLTTDFGTQDPYVAMMKGAILGIDSSAVIVDLTHEVAPQDVVQAAFSLYWAYRWFPRKTVHLAVVDPGVGSKREIIALSSKGHLFLGPDNGILSLVAQEGIVDALVKVENADLFLKPLSFTFHGRDILAPVAAHLSRGLPLQRLGSAMETGRLVRLGLSEPTLSAENELTGTIIAIDRFGNLITDITGNQLHSLYGGNALESMVTVIGDRHVAGLSRTYDEVEPKRPAVLVGSSGHLEISVNKDSAETKFNASRGDRIVIQCG